MHFLGFSLSLSLSIGDDFDCKDTKDNLSFEPSCSSIQKQMSAVTPLSSDSPEMQNADKQATTHFTVSIPMQHIKSPLNNSDHSSNQDIVLPQKIRISQAYSAHTPESMTQSIDPLDIIPKSEQEELEEREREQQHTPMQHQQQQQAVASHFFANYGHGQNIHVANAASPPTPTASVPQHQPSYTSAVMNRFRRRGERMSKDQKELYVKYFEENPCMLTQRRNDVILEPHWNKLASLLNSVPQGAVKNVEEWKQTFDAWRYRVFMYTRYNSKLTGTAAQNPKNYKPLTPTDQRAYAMWTSHKHTTPQDYDKMDMFANLDDTQTDYDY